MSSTKSGKSACRWIFRSQAKLYWRRERRVGGVRGSAAGGRLAGGGFWGRSGSPLPSPGSDAEGSQFRCYLFSLCDLFYVSKMLLEYFFLALCCLCR